MQAEMTSSLLTAILESSDEAIITKTLDGVVTSWNSVAVSLLGYSAEEAIGMNVSRIIPSDRLAEEKEILLKIQRGVRVDRFESMRLRKDGSLVDVSLIVVPVKSAEGKVIGAVKFARDFTTCRKVQSDAREVGRLQSQFAQVAEAVPGLVCSFRMWSDGRVCMPFATTRVEDLYGIPASELADDFSPVFSRVQIADRQRMIDSVHEAFKHRSNWHCKFRYNHPLKGERWIEGWSSPQIESEESVLWHGFLMDITEAEEAKSALRESDNLARSILESLTSQIAVVGEDGTILAVNHAWRDYNEARETNGQSGVGSNYLDACRSAYGDERATAIAVAEAIRDVAAGRVPRFEIEYPCDCQSSRQWFRCRISPFVGEGPRRVVVSHYDITALKLTEDRLRSRERMLAQSQAMAHIGSWESELTDFADLNANSLRWSDECLRIFGYEPDHLEVTNELFFQAVHPEDRQLVRTEMNRLIEEGIPYRVEHRIRRLDGTERVVEEWAEMIKATQNGHPRIIGTCQDITERKEIENALKKSADLLENLWRQLLRAQEDERRRIACELHDELGQALTALKINLQQMKSGSDDEEARLNDSIEIVSQALQQVRGMALDLRPSILDDLGLVAALKWYVGRHAHRTGLIGYFKADPENLRLEPDLETLCFRIAQGALTNVARHARAKSFSVELLRRREKVQLNILDDGVGFDIESTFQSVISGNSLGLAGMRERVEMIGGEIAFISQPGQGTEIRMSFPHSTINK